MNRKKRLNNNEGYKVQQCRFCKFNYKRLKFGTFCTPECALGFNSFSPEVYNAYCASFSSDPELPKDYQPSGAPKRNLDESYESYWKRVIKAIYVHPSSIGATTLKKNLEMSEYVIYESFPCNDVSSTTDNQKTSNSDIITSSSSSSSSSSMNGMCDDFENASSFFINMTSPSSLSKKRKIK